MSKKPSIPSLSISHGVRSPAKCERPSGAVTPAVRQHQSAGGPAAPDLLQAQYLQWMRMQNFSPRTIEAWEKNIERFNQWCADRGIECVSLVTDELLAAYRRWLFHYRNAKTNRPLKFTTQTSYLIAVRRWLRWLAEQKILPEPVGEKLELPKEERRLPTDVLTASEVESVLNETDITKPLGIRNRAILETFYFDCVPILICRKLLCNQSFR